MGYGFEDEEEDEFSLENYLGDMGIGIQDPLQTEMPEVNMSFDYGAAYEDPSTNFTQYHSPVQAEDLYDPNWSVDTVDIGGPLDSVLPSQGGYLSVPSSISSPFARIYKDQLLQSQTRQSELELQKEALRDNLLNMGKWGWEDRVGQIGSMLLPFFASYATGGGGNEDRRLGEAFSAASTGSELFLKDAEGRRKGEASLLAQELQNVQGELKGEDTLQRQLALKPLELEAQLQVAEARRPRAGVRGTGAVPAAIARGNALADTPEAALALLEGTNYWKALPENRKAAIMSNPAALGEAVDIATKEREAVAYRGGDDVEYKRSIADSMRHYAPRMADIVDRAPNVVSAERAREEGRRQISDMARLSGTIQQGLDATLDTVIREQMTVLPKIEYTLNQIKRLYNVEGETAMGKIAASKIRSMIPADDLRIMKNYTGFMSRILATGIFGKAVSNTEGQVFENFLNSDDMFATGEIINAFESLQNQAVNTAIAAIGKAGADNNQRNGAESAAALFVLNMAPERQGEIFEKIKKSTLLFPPEANLGYIDEIVRRQRGREYISEMNPYAGGASNDVRRPTPMTEKPREDPGTGMVWALNRKGEWVAAPLSKVRRAN